MVRGKRGVYVALMVAALLMVALLGAPQLMQAEDISEMPVSKQITYTLYEPSAGISSAAQTSAPATDAYGRNMAATNGYALADVFVTADVGSSAVLTATVQVSADQSNWANADYEYATSSAIATQGFVRTLSADGTEYMRIPLAGEYLRLSLTVSGTVTPTIKITYRN